MSARREAAGLTDASEAGVDELFESRLVPRVPEVRVGQHHAVGEVIAGAVGDVVQRGGSRAAAP